MKKVVINDCFGGFSLSNAGISKYAELSGIKLYPYKGKYKEDHIKITHEEAAKETGLFNKGLWLKNDLGDKVTHDELNNAEWFWCREIKREDVNLVKTVELLKEKADGYCAKLKVVEIPDDVQYYIHEYDGSEHVAENHRTWE